MHLFRNAHLMLAFTALFWSGNAIAGKFAVGHVSPMMLTACRWAIALVIVVSVAHHHIRNDWPVIRKSWPYLLVMGGVGYSGFNFFLYSALQHISAINVTLEQSAMPLVIFVLNFLIYRTGIAWLQVVGFVLTVSGVVVIVSSGDPIGLFDRGSSGISRGDWFMLAAALCYGGYSVALRSKPQMHWQSFLASLIGAALVFAIFGALIEHGLGKSQAPMSMQAILVLLYAGIFPSLASQAFFIRGVESLGANMAGLYINLVPVFGALLAVVFLGEELFAFHALAFVLVVGGLMIAQKRPAASAQSDDG